VAADDLATEHSISSIQNDEVLEASLATRVTASETETRLTAATLNGRHDGLKTCGSCRSTLSKLNCRRWARRCSRSGRVACVCEQSIVVAPPGLEAVHWSCGAMGRIPRLARRPVILFFWPTRASSANQILSFGQSSAFSRAIVSRRAGKLFKFSTHPQLERDRC
jgi:hypothetical protein